MVVNIFNLSVNYVGCKLTFKTIFVKKKLINCRALSWSWIRSRCRSCVIGPPSSPFRLGSLAPHPPHSDQGHWPPPFPGFVFVHASSTVQCLDPYYICTLYQKKVTFGADATEYVWIIQTYTVASAPAVHWLDFFCKDSHFKKILKKV